MSGQWKPGDVAMVTALNAREHRAYFDGDVWCEYGKPMFQTATPIELRPLVVIDPEDREQVERMALAYKATWMGGASSSESTLEIVTRQMQAALREFANPTPPKPEEPTGLGAVVESDNGTLYVRQHDGWWRGPSPCTLNWSAVHAVKVLSEGVAP